MSGKDDLDLAVVIMAGGAGTRFWPLSTEKRPKQFLKLFGDRSLLQMSFDRVAGLVSPERILVLTSESFLPLVTEQLPEIPAKNIIGEPMRRDTAAAVVLATLLCEKRFGNTIMAIMTADHLIEPVDEFQKTLLSAATAARESETLYTFGIEPTSPAPGYGYLECGSEVIDDEGIKHYSLSQFREKPDEDTARMYIEKGGYLWNSGMFVWSVESILKEIRLNLPDHLSHIALAVKEEGSANWQKDLEAAFFPLQKISIDYGVMEKAANVRTVSATFNWSDVGGWLALEEFLDKDQSGNSHHGRVESHDAADNMVFCEDENETVALVGVKDLIVIRSGRRTLVVDKKRAEEIKKLVAGLDEKLK